MRSKAGGLEVAASTGWVTLLGHPVGHSLSPAIHNAAFREHGLDLIYLANDVEPDGLEDALRGLWALGAVGANVTIPHKRGALEAAATASETATALGAANTLVRGEKGWHADNTDVAGFLAPLQEIDLEGASVAVLGAGGAARAVVYAALHDLEAADVTVVARRRDQAEALARDLEGAGGVAVAGFGKARRVVRDARLVINATPVGMGDGRSPLDPDAIHDRHVVYDLVYRPARTPLLEVADAKGAETINGLPMLLGQAAESYRLWTGRTFPLATARRAALEALAHD